jgi:hypothetical protein
MGLSKLPTQENHMLIFKSVDDITRLPETDPAHSVIATLVDGLITQTFKTDYPYDPESDGFIALIEPDDVDRPLTEIWDDWSLTDIPWEGITKQGDFFIAVFLANDQYGIVFVIPDSDWVTRNLRQCIEDNLDQLPEAI